MDMRTENMNKWVSLKTAAEYLSVSTSWLYQRGDALGVPRTKLGRSFRYNLEELEAWMNRDNRNEK
jgi:excisionase family DNA binding protein